MSAKDFKKNLFELQHMIENYFDDSCQMNYTVEGFVNQDIPCYKNYESIQEKFEVLEKIFEKDKKDTSGHMNSKNSEEYLKLVNLCDSRSKRCLRKKSGNKKRD